MSRVRWETNLGQLCRNLESYAPISPDPSDRPSRLSESLYLAHSASEDKFAAICASGRLLSKARLARNSGVSMPADCTEVLLGTTGAVFFYTSPFRYPHTGCGLLFAHTLERFHDDTGVATPFDSGGLRRHFTLPDPAEPILEFLARHEMPIPEHRRYLALTMSALFHGPEDYIEGVDPHLPGPIGLTGGDRRRWTHEVRIPDQVVLHSHYLQAAFAPRARVIGNPAIKGFFKWCTAEGIDQISFDTPGRNDFEALQRECLAYIRRKLY